MYHTNTGIVNEFSSLATSCPALRITHEGKLMVVTIASPTTTTTTTSPKLKAMLLFGEHPRELISPELSLAIAKKLCSPAGAPLLSGIEFTMVPLANAWGRAKVMAGNLCLRCNEDGVDLNRNWDLHWANNIQVDSDSGCGHGAGSKGFSEVETQALRDVLVKAAPHMFVSIHSGALAMYTPHAYDTALPTTGTEGRYETQMINMLGKLNHHTGQECPYGAAGRELGYTCSGNCLDYAFEAVKVPYSFAFEIWTPDRKAAVTEWRQHNRRLRFQALRAGNRQQQSLLEVSESAGQSTDLFTPTVGSSCFLQREQTTTAATTAAAALGTAQLQVHNTEDLKVSLSGLQCLKYFNPVDQTTFQSTLTEWTARTLTLAQMVVSHYSTTGGAVSGATAPLPPSSVSAPTTT